MKAKVTKFGNGLHIPISKKFFSENEFVEILNDKDLKEIKEKSLTEGLDYDLLAKKIARNIKDGNV